MAHSAKSKAIETQMTGQDLSLAALRQAFTEGTLTPSALIRALYPALEEAHGCFVSLATFVELQDRCRYLEGMHTSARQGLWGVPFAVKDNIDALPFQTTAACPAFSYQPERSAPAVQALLDAGAILVGKSNMDQFAAGLVGTRTPYGVARNAFDSRFIPGGSSSGSGALVGSGLVTFALGTDTAGSGRVPAMLNGCVGIKPTVGSVSCAGVVPACRSLDCISCFARTVEDGAAVTRIMQSAGSLQDPAWRPPQHLPAQTGIANGTKDPPATGRRFKFGVPDGRFLDFEGPGGQLMATEYHRAFRAAAERMQGLGGELVPVDFAPFCEVAALLYNSAFVAERYAGIRDFLEAKPNGGTRDSLLTDKRLERVTAAIIAQSTRYTAADVYVAFARLSELKAQARLELAKVDLLLVPTALQHFLIAEIEAEEKCEESPSWSKNTLSGRFTNFVNLLDLAAVSVPSAVLQHPDLPGKAAEGSRQAAEVERRALLLQLSGNRAPHLPFGVTLIGPAWTDEFLWEVGADMHKLSGLGCGPTGHGVTAFQQAAPAAHAV